MQPGGTHWTQCSLTRLKRVGVWRVQFFLANDRSHMVGFSKALHRKLNITHCQLICVRSAPSPATLTNTRLVDQLGAGSPASGLVWGLDCGQVVRWEGESGGIDDGCHA